MDWVPGDRGSNERYREHRARLNSMSNGASRCSSHRYLQASSSRMRGGPANRSASYRRMGPKKKIIKNRKPYAVRKANCDAQNALSEQSLRKEYDELGEGNPFDPAPANGGLKLYCERESAASGGFAEGLLSVLGKGGNQAMKMKDRHACSSSTDFQGRFTRDLSHYKCFVRHQNIAAQVVAEVNGGTVDEKEARAVFLALWGHADVSRGQNLVREAVSQVARARKETLPSEDEIRAVMLRIESMLASSSTSVAEGNGVLRRRASKQSIATSLI